MTREMPSRTDRPAVNHARRFALTLTAIWVVVTVASMVIIGQIAPGAPS